MEYTQLVDQLTPDLVERFRKALETGAWPDGRPLSDAQKESCMQAVIAFEARHCPPESRVGFIDRGRKAGQQCDDEPAPISWLDGELSDEEGR
jgi:uncharacterized protein YeaC (DUF1315 family)